MKTTSGWMDLACFMDGKYFLGIGAAWIIKNWKENKVLAAWLVLAPLPAIITQSWFNPVRVLPLWAANTILLLLG